MYRDVLYVGGFNLAPNKTAFLCLNLSTFTWMDVDYVNDVVVSLMIANERLYVGGDLAVAGLLRNVFGIAVAYLNGTFYDNMEGGIPSSIHHVIS